MKYVIGLRCKECGSDYPIAPQHVCELCFGPLEVFYDYDAIAAEVSRETIAEGPQTLWRYGTLLPKPSEGVIDIGAGWGKLRPAPRLAAELGLRKLWLKSEAGNPTHSFKDRVVTVALSVARSFGYRVAACASTGNLANAVAAHAAASGMESVVFIPHDLEAGKVAGTVVYGGKVLAVRGSYDEVNRLCAELVAETEDWAFVNVNLRPFYSEGSKTVGFEIAEQLGWRAPDVVVAPVASGSLLTKVAKGFREFQRTGLIDSADVTIHGAQAAGCSPVANAFAAGAEDVQPVKPNTVAKSLAIGDPADGYYVLKEVRENGGRVVAVPEEDVVAGIRLLARTEGLFTETAGGVTVSALESLVREGAIGPDDETVILITGIGLKTLEALGPQEPTALIDADVEAAQAIVTGGVSQ
ncbi:MAG TPA: threonine synthase [Actinomycetota bacterium]|nr:threonine synthase [Actinomycetota bacterium]